MRIINAEFVKYDIGDVNVCTRHKFVEIRRLLQ